MSQVHKPLLAITMGDAAGSGPEIITKALAEREINAMCRPDTARMWAVPDSM